MRPALRPAAVRLDSVAIAHPLRVEKVGRPPSRVPVNGRYPSTASSARETTTAGRESATLIGDEMPRIPERHRLDSIPRSRGSPPEPDATSAGL